MVVVAHPRERRHGRDDKRHIREQPNDEDGVVLIDQVAVGVHYLVRDPDDTRDGAASVDPAKVL